MISSVLAIALATLGVQSDTTRAQREAFTSCLRTYVDRSLDDGMSAETFQTEYPQQCAAEESAFRAAVIRRETSARASQADAEDAANLAVEDARLNFSERFELAVPARSEPEAPAAEAPAEAASEPAPEPAAAPSTPE